jgi:hypothetical protein
MIRKSVLLLAGALCCSSLAANAQTTAPAKPAPAKIALTKAHMKEMHAKWKANKPKLAACRKDAKSKGLAGDDRWFYLADCMDKS